MGGNRMGGDAWLLAVSTSAVHVQRVVLSREVLPTGLQLLQIRSGAIPTAAIDGLAFLKAYGRLVVAGLGYTAFLSEDRSDTGEGFISLVSCVPLAVLDLHAEAPLVEYLRTVALAAAQLERVAGLGARQGECTATPGSR